MDSTIFLKKSSSTNLQISGWGPCSRAQHGLFLTAAVTYVFTFLLLNKNTNQRGEKEMHRQVYTRSTDYIRSETTNLTRGVDVLGWGWFSGTVVSLTVTNRSLSFRQLSSLWCSLLTSACSICMEILTTKKKRWNSFRKKQTNRWLTKFATMKSTLIATCPCECTGIFRKQPHNTANHVETQYLLKCNRNQ